MKNILAILMVGLIISLAGGCGGAGGGNTANQAAVVAPQPQAPTSITEEVPAPQGAADEPQDAQPQEEDPSAVEQDAAADQALLDVDAENAEPQGSADEADDDGADADEVFHAAVSLSEVLGDDVPIVTSDDNSLDLLVAASPDEDLPSPDDDVFENLGLVQTSATPEPVTFMLVAIALGSVGLTIRRRR